MKIQCTIDTYSRICLFFKTYFYRCTHTEPVFVRMVPRIMTVHVFFRLNILNITYTNTKIRLYTGILFYILAK